MNIISSTKTNESFQNVLGLIQTSKKIIALVGPGISVNCGIPTFRDSKEYGKQIFDYTQVKSDLKVAIQHTKLLGELKLLLLENLNPSPTHWLLKTLADLGKLQRIYTQNIDDLESITGLERIDSLQDAIDSPINFYKKVVQLHGHLRTLYCTFCSYECEFTEEHASLYSEYSCDISCRNCESDSFDNARQGARQGGVGRLVSRVVLQNETHDEFIDTLFDIDLNETPDLLLIMGTSLESKHVKNFASKLVKDLQVKTILMDLNLVYFPGCNRLLYHLKGPCDDFSTEIISFLNKSVENHSTWNYLSNSSYNEMISFILKSKIPLDSIYNFLSSLDPNFNQMHLLNHVKSMNTQKITKNYSTLQSITHLSLYLSLYKSKETNLYIIQAHYISDSFSKQVLLLDVIQFPQEFARIVEQLKAHTLDSKIIGILYSCSETLQMAKLLDNTTLWRQSSIEYLCKVSLDLVYNSLSEFGISHKGIQKHLVESLDIFKAYDSLFNTIETCPSKIAVKIHELDSCTFLYENQLETLDMDYALKALVAHVSKKLKVLRREYVHGLKDIMLLCFALDPQSFLAVKMEGKIKFEDLIYKYASSEWKSTLVTIDLNSPNHILFTLKSEIAGYFKLLTLNQPKLMDLNWESFWSLNKSSFPRLYLLARKYLAIPFYSCPPSYSSGVSCTFTPSEFNTGEANLEWIKLEILNDKI